MDERVEGTADYVAPEVAGGGKTSFFSDAWALGCVVFQLLAGHCIVLHDEADNDAAMLLASLPILNESPDPKCSDTNLTANLHSNLKRHRAVSRSMWNPPRRIYFPGLSHQLPKFWSSGSYRRLPPNVLEQKLRSIGGLESRAMITLKQWTLLVFSPPRRRHWVVGQFRRQLRVNLTIQNTDLDPDRNPDRAGERGWNRRKQSMMWAPMPESYKGQPQA